MLIVGHLTEEVRVTVILKKKINFYFEVLDLEERCKDKPEFPFTPDEGCSMLCHCGIVVTVNKPIGTW